MPVVMSPTLKDSVCEFTVVDEIRGTPSVPRTPVTPLPDYSNIENMIKRNFDRVWGQIEDMFQDFREKMESDTQRALLLFHYGCMGWD
jgi:hypothetical protein